MSKVIVLFHSGYGHTARLAEAVATGARQNFGTEATILTVEEVEENWDALDEADAIIFGCPTYMGSVSAAFKAFIELTSGRFSTGAWVGKVAGGFTVSASQSGDKLSTLFQLAIFAAQLGMIWVGVDLLPGNNNSAGSPDDLNRLGSKFGMMAQANADEGPELMLESDLKTAEHLGKRIASVAARLHLAAA